MSHSQVLSSKVWVSALEVERASSSDSLYQPWNSSCFFHLMFLSSLLLPANPHYYNLLEQLILCIDLSYSGYSKLSPDRALKQHCMCVYTNIPKLQNGYKLFGNLPSKTATLLLTLIFFFFLSSE